ncbi:hypothetical protein ACFPTO_22120 [Paraburkholderia denitrificans]|uniref:Apea-like HEPN domain-containing protein n=1 Tax=Paraburkholderia denitrificans TaxID=694025 RepID=A0ABW0JEQ6_9BURK
MSFEQEFAVVDIIKLSEAETRGVDAFTLSIVKMERQVRRLFTYLVFQCEAFNEHSVPDLIATLERCRNAYFTGFISGIDALAGFSVSDLVGDEYARLRVALKAAYDVRNKVFHGQLTGLSLDREELLAMVTTVKRWCELLANGAQRESGYDGFGGNSFRKSCMGLAANYKHQLTNVDDYSQFIDRHVAGRMRW